MDDQTKELVAIRTAIESTIDKNNSLPEKTRLANLIFNSVFVATVRNAVSWQCNRSKNSSNVDVDEVLSLVYYAWTEKEWKWPTYGHLSNDEFLPYLWRIAQRTAARALLKLRTMGQTSRISYIEEIGTEIQALAISPIDRMDAIEIWERMQAIVSSLSPSMRAFAICYLGGFGTEEIAARLGIEISVVHARVSRLRKQIGRYIDKAQWEQILISVTELSGKEMTPWAGGEQFSWNQFNEYLRAHKGIPVQIANSLLEAGRLLETELHGREVRAYVMDQIGCLTMEIQNANPNKRLLEKYTNRIKEVSPDVATVLEQIVNIDEARDNKQFEEPLHIFEKLTDENTCDVDLLNAILVAEKLPFPAAKKNPLLNALARFIGTNRLTEDEDRIVYVASAIRKYAMNMSESQFDAYAAWLVPTDTTPVHHVLEMEFVKALSYRLQFERVHPPLDCQSLLDTLVEIADTYLRRSIVLQKSYANTTMLALVCFSVLEATTEAKLTVSILNLLEKVRSLQVPWFEEMVFDALEVANSYVSNHSPEIALRMQFSPKTH